MSYGIHQASLDNTIWYSVMSELWIKIWKSIIDWPHCLPQFVVLNVLILQLRESCRVCTWKFSVLVSLSIACIVHEFLS